MWIPVIIGGAALFWYLGKDEAKQPPQSAQKKTKPKKIKIQVPPIPEGLSGYLTSKPSDWNEITEIPEDVYADYLDYFDLVPTYKTKTVWGKEKCDIFEDFKSDFTHMDPFMVECQQGTFLIDPQGSRYARYVARIGDE